MSFKIPSILFLLLLGLVGGAYKLYYKDEIFVEIIKQKDFFLKESESYQVPMIVKDISIQTRFFVSCSFPSTAKDRNHELVLKYEGREVKTISGPDSFRRDLFLLLPFDRESVDHVILLKKKHVDFKIFIRSKQVLESKVACTFTIFKENRYFARGDEPLGLYHQKLKSVHKKRNEKTFLFIGGSTFIDNGGFYDFPRIFEYKLKSEGKEVNIVNGGMLGATLLDHIYNWDHLQKNDSSSPLFVHSAFDDLTVLDNFLNSRWENEHFGWKDLSPDLIVIGSMWNDLFNSFFFNRVDSGVGVEDGKVLFTEWIIDVMEYMTNPRLLQKKKIKKRSIQIFDNKNKYLKIAAVTAMKMHYQRLNNILINKIRESGVGAPIILVSIPFATFQSMSNEVKEKMKNNLFIYSYFEGLYGRGDDIRKKIISFYEKIDEVQREVLSNISKNNEDVYYFDLTQIYQQQAHRFEEDYFTVGIFNPDLCHFSSVGNIYLSELLYVKFKEYEKNNKR